mgnify:FL=1
MMTMMMTMTTVMTTMTTTMMMTMVIMPTAMIVDGGYVDGDSGNNNEGWQYDGGSNTTIK